MEAVKVPTTAINEAVAIAGGNDEYEKVLLLRAERVTLVHDCLQLANDYKSYANYHFDQKNWTRALKWYGKIDLLVKRFDNVSGALHLLFCYSRTMCTECCRRHSS